MSGDFESGLMKEPLITPPCCCVLRAADPTKFETCLYGLEAADHGANHRRQNNLFMILGMGELHLEVIQYKLEHEFGLSFKLVRSASVVLLEPWISLQVQCLKDHLGDISDELRKRQAELENATKGAFAEMEIKGVMPGGQTFGMFDKLRELTGGTASVSTEFCDYRAKLDWTLLEEDQDGS
jgi:translation elongation factor EF-G